MNVVAASWKAGAFSIVLAKSSPEPMNNATTDTELLLGISTGDAKAFRVFFDTNRKKLYAFILHMVKSREVAEEIVMDVFMRIWQGRDLLRLVDNIDGFLFKVAYNKSVDFLRAAARTPELEQAVWEELQPASDVHADTRLLLRDYEERLREAMELLPPKRKQVYLLSREHGLSHDQIADMLHISRNTVNNHIVTSQQFIRNYLVKNLDLGSTAFIAFIISRI
ncbi:RNA polymerase sigma-70 factor (ECF subfamily) [Chitinophaga dinghuensis]|uniref:RNA polymerase sigma-70 factor (ECF subfamily) n=2 Tax=Chitinophaga dinghuensis TaxID=1539050 RepID=A0A327W2P4_9BACT|nr:RNA polymerase sigma-70 factor (ECF subfamily) [Chitinophaga dinghuensis]